MLLAVIRFACLFGVYVRTCMHSNVALLSTTDPANITDPPVKVIVNQSSSAQFGCIAFGNPIPQIVWSKVGDNDLSNNEEETINVTQTVNSNEYIVISFLTINTTIRSRDEGMFYCTAVNNVTNSIGADNIQSTRLVVQGEL